MNRQRKQKVLYAAFLSVVIAGICVVMVGNAGAAEKPLRIIVFGAHPDDCEIRCGAVGAMWAQKGHQVKFVSTTNGDIGHSTMAGGPLALRRTKEVEEAAAVLGIAETQVLDIHDGEIMPTLENRRTFIRLIREWDADIVITNRTNDYHPDHRYTSILVQDAAYMVTVPFICPDTPPLKKNPVFLYWPDRFQKPYPFQADIIVDVGDVIETEFRALNCLVSQFQEGGANGPGDPELFFKGTPEESMNFTRNRFARRYYVQDNWRPLLEEYYGKEHASKVKYVNAFEICEYGRRPNREEIKRMFPFYPDSPK